ncbi:MAG: YiiX/YebB-like N1pC/P60 family cysteine hydrolase [Gemmatimonadaceae bacterium]
MNSFGGSRKLVAAAGVATLLGLLLAVPGPEAPVAAAPRGARSFAWNRDAYWNELQARFEASERTDCSETEAPLMREMTALEAGIVQLGVSRVGPDALMLDSLENRFFGIAPMVAACPARLPDYARVQTALRESIKEQSRRWDMTTATARTRIYQSLYGSRAALEEAMLHHPARVPDVLAGTGAQSLTPAAAIEGITIHSGDILVSRGGYPTSALISRGSDYPGNFSHVALVHVDSASGFISVIEAHIERGVAVSSGEEYLSDKKRRILILRPRADLPEIVSDPMLPHRAASQMLARARAERIPYDFTMDYGDPSRLFCSEVASSVYRERGLQLWTGLSTISAPGLRRWLSSFGVRHFETQEPSDLEYDPQLVVVAEWRDPASLASDHVDNAVIDAMLEGAERGDALHYDWYRLPPARLAKAYSSIMNLFGGVGPIPEGMSARSALRNQAFSARQRYIAAEVAARSSVWQNEHGYPPPYWALLAIARDVTAAI